MKRGAPLLSAMLALAACAAPGPDALFDDGAAPALMARAERLERLGRYPEARLVYEAAAATGASVDDRITKLDARAGARASKAFGDAEKLRRRGDDSAARASYLLALAYDPSRKDAFERLRELERRRTVASFAAPPPAPTPKTEEPDEAEPSIEEFKKSFGDYFNRVRSVLEQGADGPAAD